jgi:hypothetical protein
MDETGESDTGDVSAGAVDTLEFPDCFGGTGEVIREESTAILLGEAIQKFTGKTHTQVVA